MFAFSFSKTFHYLHSHLSAAFHSLTFYVLLALSLASIAFIVLLYLLVSSTH